MFDIKNLEKSIIEVAKKNKIEMNCPKCELYIWEYSLNELNKWWEIYCNNCDILIDFNVEF